MRVAMIAPPSLAQLNVRTGLTLALPLLSHRTKYAEAISNNSGYTILDNGAAEAQPTDMEELLRLGRAWAVDEIVLPDVLGNARATVRTTKDAIRSLSKADRYEFKFSAVAQGNKLPEAFDCALELEQFAFVDRIMIPRILTYTAGKSARIDLARMLATQGVTNIHCLGASPWIDEVKELAKIPAIDSIDTSMPIYLGYMGYDINHLEHDAYKLRPKGYFSFGHPNGTQADIIINNCRTFYKWANPETSDGRLRELFPELSGFEVLPE